MERIYENEDERIKQRMLSVADEETIEWMQKKSEAFVKLMSYYRCAMMEIETKLNVLNEEYSLEHDRNPINSIKTRLKSVPSMKNKMERLGADMTLAALEEKLNDVAGVRVVCSFEEDVYTLADALLKQDDIILIEKKDYIENPKPNGYRSLHIIVAIPIFLAHEKRMMKVEIQLRTIAMDFWASLEHQLRYKTTADVPDEIRERLTKIADDIFTADLEMQAIYNEISELE